MIRRLQALFFLTFTAIFFHAQTTTIEWQQGRIQDFGTYKFTLPYFATHEFSFAQNNIFLHRKIAVAENSIAVENLVWNPVPEAELFQLNRHALTEKDEISISYSTVKNERFANISVATFKKSGNQILRLSSFAIVTKPASNPTYGEKVGTTNNPLSAGTFHKIKVDRSGIFKITKDFLSSNGINVAGVNPQNLRVYGNGGIMLPENNQDIRYDALQENAIEVVGESDGVWNDGDYALFYAQGPHGYNLYDNGNGGGIKRQETRSDPAQHLKNIYEDFSYYFISFDNGPGKRVQTQDEILPANLITRYDDYQFINEDEANLMKLGRTWVDDTPFIAPKAVTFTTKSPVQPGDEIRYRAKVIAYNANAANIAIDLNSQNPYNASIGGNVEYSPVLYNGISTNMQGNTLTFNFNPNIGANPNATFYFDYAEVQYKENLTFTGDQMNFRDFAIVTGSGTLHGFSVSNSSTLEQIWDVSDITNAKRRVNKSGNNSVFDFGYRADYTVFNNEFVAFRADAAFSPTYVGPVQSQNLQALQNIDYLVLTVPSLMGQAQRIANYHQNNTNLTTQVVDIGQIYNEYSSGGQDLTALRDFITELNRPAGELQYVFILGDASYDFKNRVTNNSNIVPAYQSEESGNYVSSFVMDDYIVMTEPQVNSNLLGIIPDIPVGRLPAATLQEATVMVDKTLAYYNSKPGQSTPFGVWRMKMDYVADDDHNETSTAIPFHTIVNDAIVNIFEGTTDKPEYNIRKLYLDSFVQQSSAGGPRYPQVNQAITNDLSNSLFMLYFGHGGINGWAQERVFTLQEIQAMNNYNNIYSRFPLITTITCEFTLWDEPNTASAGEQVIKFPTGGAANMITSSRAIFINYAERFTETYLDELFELHGDDFLSVGKTFLEAKRIHGPANDHFKVNVLGDPAMKLSRPKRQAVVNSIVTPVPGLMRALDFVQIQGQVNLPNGTLNTGFNGEVTVNIFDKRLNKTTLNNDGILNPVLTYTEEGNAIIKATGNVVDGLFTVEFYVPYNINYTVGTGRMLVYAHNNQEDVFNNSAIQIGDINPNGINDNEPPRVKLYMNNVHFADGGITDRDPMLLACITDDTGINSTGAGIGHDITVYLDGEIINTIVLNDFYNPGDGLGCSEPTLKNYQKGYVSYPFRNLAPGEHTLTFKVWDINNNSTTETLKFIVKEEGDQQMVINRLLNWPNPFTNKTYIQFEHNCDDIVDVNVQIFTITGKLVRTMSQSVSGEPFFEGYRTPRQAIEWDGKDDFGDTVAKGTYIFKVYARSQNQEKCKGGATAAEKMVMLK